MAGFGFASRWPLLAEQCTVRQRIGVAPLNKNLAKAAAVGALGGFLFGFDTAVISGTTQALTGVYHLTPGQLGLTVSMALIGTVIGAMTAGIPGQKYGGREKLRFPAVCYVVFSLGCAF